MVREHDITGWDIDSTKNTDSIQSLDFVNGAKTEGKVYRCSEQVTQSGERTVASRIEEVEEVVTTH